MANIEEKRQGGRRESDRRTQDRRGTDRRAGSTAGRVVKILMGVLVLLLVVLFYFFTVGL